MDATIDGFLAFMQQEPESISRDDLTRGQQLMKDFSQELLYLSGIPRPIPTPTLPANARELIGTTVTLRPGTPAGDNNVIVAANVSAMLEFLRARNAGTLDMATVQTMASAGMLWRIDAGNRGRVLSAQPTDIGLLYQIQVIDGPSAGGQGWVEATSLH
jgi:hypothetical protein